MRLIDADVLLAKFNKKTDLWSALTDEKTSNEFALYCKVADAIEDTPTVGGWTSVKERLPEEKVNPITQDFAEVICFCDFGGIPRRTDIRTYKFGKRRWAEGGHFWHDGQIMDGVITHWMSLPEPPEEVIDGDK